MGMDGVIQNRFKEVWVKVGRMQVGKLRGAFHVDHGLERCGQILDSAGVLQPIDLTGRPGGASHALAHLTQLPVLGPGTLTDACAHEKKKLKKKIGSKL